MNKEKWYKRDDVEYWKKEYLELSKQLEEKEIVLDKIKEIINHYAVEDEDYSKIYNQEEKDILELLEEKE